LKSFEDKIITKNVCFITALLLTSVFKLSADDFLLELIPSGVPGVAREDQWRNGIKILCIM
jgi:hypothetical protein